MATRLWDIREEKIIKNEGEIRLKKMEIELVGQMPESEGPKERELGNFFNIRHSCFRYNSDSLQRLVFCTVKFLLLSCQELLYHIFSFGHFDAPLYACNLSVIVLPSTDNSPLTVHCYCGTLLLISNLLCLHLFRE